MSLEYSQEGHYEGKVSLSDSIKNLSIGGPTLSPKKLQKFATIIDTKENSEDGSPTENELSSGRTTKYADGSDTLQSIKQTKADSSIKTNMSQAPGELLVENNNLTIGKLDPQSNKSFKKDSPDVAQRNNIPQVSSSSSIDAETIDLHAKRIAPTGQIIRDLEKNYSSSSFLVSDSKAEGSDLKKDERKSKIISSSTKEADEVIEAKLRHSQGVLPPEDSENYSERSSGVLSFGDGGSHRESQEVPLKVMKISSPQTRSVKLSPSKNHESYLTSTSSNQEGMVADIIDEYDSYSEPNNDTMRELSLIHI